MAAPRTTVHGRYRGGFRVRHTLKRTSAPGYFGGYRPSPCENSIAARWRSKLSFRVVFQNLILKIFHCCFCNLGSCFYA
jgi:hypothetical protein